MSLNNDNSSDKTSSPTTSETESLNSTINSNIRISDAGVYSLCGLTSILFHQLYPEDSNREFCKETITALLDHLDLSSNQVKNSMYALLDGEGGHPEDFIVLLKSEELLKSSCVPLIEALILFSIRNGIYDARLRVYILKIADLFNIPVQLVNFHEESVIEMLSNDASTQSDEQLKEKDKRLRNKKIKKYLLIGSGTIIGGAILGLTGGLVAPYLMTSLVGVFGAGSAVLGSTTGVAIIGSLFGVAGAGLTGHKMKKRVGDIEEFAFEKMNDGKSLEITIFISGWISNKDEDAFKKPWLAVQNTSEQYCIRYESNYLLELGKALDYFLGFAISLGVQEALKFTILSGIMAAVAWPTTLLTFSSVIDNPWSCSVRRSADCGRQLAEVLLNREHGKRPVSLIGFSLGARVIFFCLLELAQRENSEGIVQDAILLGTPVSGSLEYWSKFNKVVSGRIVNGYCAGDWLLKFLYRTTNASIKIAGLNAIDWKDRRMENVDLSDIVAGHLDYYRKLPEVLKKVRVPVNDNELNQTNSLMKRSATGIPQQAELKSINELSYCFNIRMSISEPNFSQKFNKTENRTFELFENGKLERSLSFEDLQIKRSKKYSKRLSSSKTCADFKNETVDVSLSVDNSSNEKTLVNKSLNENSDTIIKNSSSNDSINKSNNRPLNRYRFSNLFRFGKKTANIEESNEIDEIKDNLKDDLKDDSNDLKEKLTNDAEHIIKDEKLKDESQIKLDDVIKDELKENLRLEELNDEKNKELNKIENQTDLSIKMVKHNEADFLQLNVENLNLKNSNALKKI